MKNKLTSIIFASLILSSNIGHCADSAGLFTPEELARFVFAPKKDTMLFIDKTSLSDRAWLTKSFRDIQRERAKILQKDFSDNQISITQENMKNPQKVSDFIFKAMDDKQEIDYSKFIKTDKNLPLSEDVFSEKNKEEIVEEKTTIIEEEPQEIIIKESDTIKHIQTRQKFGN